MVFETRFTNDLLISELRRFVKEHGHTPRYIDVGRKHGYPSNGTYVKRFGSWNNALVAADITINNLHKSSLDGEEVCFVCGGPKKHQWCYNVDGNRLCSKCYNTSKTKHKNGNLDSMSGVGKGFISQRIVAKTLNIPLINDCNCSIDFKAPYDLFHDKYGKIDVKASGLRTKYNNWQFYFKAKTDADIYFCLAFDEEWKKIMRVWAIPNTGRYQSLTGITITNNISPILKYSKYEASADKYDKVFHSMSIERCTVLKNR